MYCSDRGDPNGFYCHEKAKKPLAINGTSCRFHFFLVSLAFVSNADRESVGLGKRVVGRVDVGGRLAHSKKKKYTATLTQSLSTADTR